MRFAIQWKKFKPSEKVVDIIAPNTHRDKISLLKAVEKFLSNVTFRTVQQKYTHKYSAECYLEYLGPEQDINAITFSDVEKIDKKMSKEGYSNTTIWTIKANLASVIRWNKGLSEIASQSPHLLKSIDKPVKLVTSFASINTLKNLLSLHERGRFATLKMTVKQRIGECPPDQYVVIPATREQIHNKNERQAIRNAINSMLDNLQEKWTCQWSNVENVFLIVREKQWDQIKGEMK